MRENVVLQVLSVLQSPQSPQVSSFPLVPAHSPTSMPGTADIRHQHQPPMDADQVAADFEMVCPVCPVWFSLATHGPGEKDMPRLQHLAVLAE